MKEFVAEVMKINLGLEECHIKPDETHNSRYFAL